MLHFANYALQCVIIESITSVQLQKTIPWTTMVLAEKKSLCPKWGSKKLVLSPWIQYRLPKKYGILYRKTLLPRVLLLPSCISADIQKV